MSLFKDVFNFKNMQIRLAWRAGIICALCVFFEETWIKAESPGWIVITALVCTQTNVGSSIRKTKQRLLGTCFACALAFLVYYSHPHNHAFFVILLMFSLIISMYFITSYTYFVFFLTFSVLLLYILIFPNGSYFILLRMKDVGIGAIFGIAGTLLLWPNFAQKNFKYDIHNAVTQLKELFCVINAWMLGEKTEEDVFKQKEISAYSNQNARERLLEIIYEIKKNKKFFREYDEFIRSLERIHYILLTIFNTWQVSKQKENNYEVQKLSYLLKRLAKDMQTLEDNVDRF